MSERRVLGGLLAAGRSRRFGPGDKLLAPLSGRPLVAFAARRLREAGCDTLAAVAGAPVNAVLGPGYARIAPASQSAELGDNLALLARYADASGLPLLLIHLGDMPLVPATHLRALVERTSECIPAVSGVGDRLQAPCCFPSSWYRRLADLSGDRGASSLLSRNRCKVVDLLPELALDADQGTDFARLQEILADNGDGTSPV